MLDDHKPQAFDKLENYDKIVVCGTPWLWDQFQKSHKYLNLLSLFKRYENTPKIFMGAGSCITLDAINDSTILKTDEEVKGIQALYQNTTVIVRDQAAYKLLRNANVESTLLPCPAYFCYYGEAPKTTKEKNVLVYVDPTKLISSIDWQSKEKLQNYNDQVLKFYNDYKPLVVIANDYDREACLKLGLPEPTLLKTSQDTKNLMRTADNVFSGRVHCAVPAKVAGANVTLFPFDSRYLVLNDFNNLTDFEPFKHQYINLLKG